MDNLPPPPPEDIIDVTGAVELLAPYISDLKHPRLSILRIEVFVALAAGMLFLQLILGPCRRRSGHWSIQGTLWVAYTLSFPVITYTLGQMLSTPLKNVMYPFWAILLFWTAGCTNSVTAYDLDDNKQWKRHLFELFQYLVYSVLILVLLSPTDEENPSNSDSMSATLLVLLCVSSCSNTIRVLACWSSTNSLSSKLVADYMRYPRSASVGYLFGIRRRISEKLFSRSKGPSYHTRLSNDAVITIDKVVELGATSSAAGDYSDVCISFALSRLLKCRFFGMDCDEAATSSAGPLLSMLCSEQYTRAFRIIEVELGFLYDFFFTKYVALHALELPNLIIVALKLTLMFICGALLLGGSFTLSATGYLITVVRETVDVTVTLVIMGGIVLVEALQGVLYLWSDWATVSLATSDAYGGGKGSRRLIVPSIIRFLRRFNMCTCWNMFGYIIRFLRRFNMCTCWNMFGYWQNKLGQSSVIEDCLHVNPDFFYGGPQNYATDFCASLIFKRKKLTAVPDLAKRNIVCCLHNYVERRGGGEPAEWEETEAHRRFLEEFAATLRSGENPTRIMLTWHVATEFCYMESSGEEVEGDDGKEEKEYKEAATALSRYCAYLMAFIPDFLPGSSVDTQFIYNCVLMEAKEVRRGARKEWHQLKSRKKILLEAIDKFRTERLTLTDEEAGVDSIFITGLERGRDLEKSIQDGVSRWKMLTEFWVQTVMYIAPSDKVKAHMERLAQGGEFLTHVWALLTHAGILKRDQLLLLSPQDPPQAPHFLS